MNKDPDNRGQNSPRANRRKIRQATVHELFDRMIAEERHGTMPPEQVQQQSETESESTDGEA